VLAFLHLPHTNLVDETGAGYPHSDCRAGWVHLPWVRKFTATPNSPILPLEPIDFLQEGWR
jgi:hypothetical protein